MGVEKTLGPFETRPGGVEREEGGGYGQTGYRTSTWDEGGAENCQYSLRSCQSSEEQVRMRFAWTLNF